MGQVAKEKRGDLRIEPWNFPEHKDYEDGVLVKQSETTASKMSTEQGQWFLGIKTRKMRVTPVPKAAKLKRVNPQANHHSTAMAEVAIGKHHTLPSAGSRKMEVRNHREPTRVTRLFFSMRKMYQLISRELLLRYKMLQHIFRKKVKQRTKIVDLGEGSFQE